MQCMHPMARLHTHPSGLVVQVRVLDGVVTQRHIVQLYNTNTHLLSCPDIWRVVLVVCSSVGVLDMHVGII